MLKRLLIGIIVAMGLLLSVALGLYLYTTISRANTPIDVPSATHNGRTSLRSYINQQFEKQGVSVQLLTRLFKDGAYVEIPKITRWRWKDQFEKYSALNA